MSMIDFELPDDVKALRARVATFIDQVVLPAEGAINCRPWSFPNSRSWFLR